MSFWRKEHRSLKRFSRFVPIRVRILGPEPRNVEGITKDVSETGVFLYTDVAVEPGAQVELAFVMPKEVTLTMDMSVHATGRILRVTKSLEKFGVAVAVDTFAMD